MSDSDFAVFDESNFDAEVLARHGVVLVDFWADGCVPCKQLSRQLAELADDIPPGVRIGTVNTGSNPFLADRFGVRTVPTLMFFKDGTI